MNEEPEKIQDSTEEATGEEEEHDKGHGESNVPVKVTPFLRILPTALMKFSSLKKNRMSPDKVWKLKEIQTASLENSFGLGPLVFPSLQRFNNINVFLILYCFVGLSQGLIFGLIDLSTGLLEDRFYLSKAEKVLLFRSYDFTSLLLAMPVAYYGSRRNRSKWVAAAAFLVGLGSIVCAVPFMKYEVIVQQEVKEELCVEEERKTKADCSKFTVPHRSEIISLFILGQCIEGFAGMPIYILALTFIYDHTTIYSSGIYIGISEAVQVLGYGLGYTVGSQNLKPLEDETSTKLEKYDILWQINWWASFLSASVLAWLTVVPLLCFPSHLPGSQKLRLRKEKEPMILEKNLKNKHLGPSLSNLLEDLQCLLKSPLLMCLTLCKAIDSLASTGVSEFLPTYLENQFLLTPTLATLFTGIILIPAVAVGSFLGGLIVSKLKMSCKSQMKFVIVVSVSSLLLFILIIFVECTTEHYAGFTEDYDGTGSYGNLTAPCNIHCGCKSTISASVCGRDDIEYFSPCFAGCTSSKQLNDEKTFYNCSCIKEGLTNTDAEGHFIDAVPGKCDNKCFKLPLFFAFCFSSVVFSSLAAIPITLIILRTLPTNLKSMAMGVTYTNLRMFGTIPGPLLLQFAASKSCIYWDINKCGGKGRCWIHDKSKMSSILLGICGACKLSTVFLVFYSFNKYKKIVAVDNSENMDQPEKKQKETKKKERKDF